MEANVELFCKWRVGEEEGQLDDPGCSKENLSSSGKVGEEVEGEAEEAHPWAVEGSSNPFAFDFLSTDPETPASFPFRDIDLTLKRDFLRKDSIFLRIV